MVQENNITSQVWEEFYDIFDNLSSVTIVGGSVISIKNMSSGFPEEVFDSKTNYPLLIVNTPNFETNPITYTNREYTGRIEVEVLTNQSESADKFKDQMLKIIRENESNLRAEGIDEIELDDDASDHYDRNKIKVHSRKLVWRFKTAF